MSINKWLLFLLFITGVCAACTKEDVVHREEGKITIVPVWENYTGGFYPEGMKYYFYNVSDHSDHPVVVEDVTGRSVITQILPVGTYQLVGHNTNVSTNLVFDTTKHFTVVAKLQSYSYPDPYVPLNLCIISSKQIVIQNKDDITKEIIPVEVKTKSLELIFRPSEDIAINKIRGTLDGVFTSINLINGKAFEDGSDILFDIEHPNNKIKFLISDVYSPSIENEEGSFGFSYEKSRLSLTIEVIEGGEIKKKTGEFDLNEVIEEIRNNKIQNDDIAIYVDINKYDNFQEKVKLDVTPQ